MSDDSLQITDSSADPDRTRSAGVGGAYAGGTPIFIGHYRVLRLVGEGGMGRVYEAEQEQPRRVVALKVIKPGLAAPELLRRFQHESQALGRLQHPGIAQIHEAGTADAGSGPQPYFAMEFIRGQSLLEFAEARRLNTRQRLELMARVCDGVHHAHQRGLIHRDLKPGNILVDETGQPKILDFGVARVTDSDVQATQHTDLGQLVGTLAYMSPEQVLADPLELDIRSDVYALGVVLYELLGGRLPYDLKRRQLYDAVQTIREQDPVPLSSIDRAYRGDVETIVAKALEKDKTRRYSSAADLAADIRRWLADEPIVARPSSAGYQLQKFARRHKGLVAGVAAVFVVLILGIVASTWQAARALAEKRRADVESATAKAVNEFLRNDLLAQASANAQATRDNRPDPDIKVRTALDRAAKRISGKFDAQPLVEASIRETIGRTYNDLGLYEEAQRQTERVVELRRRVLGDGHAETLSSSTFLADLDSMQGRYAQAEAILNRVIQAQRATLGEEHDDTVESMVNLAVLYRSQGKYAEAEPLYTRVLEVLRRVHGRDHSDTLTVMNNLAVLYRVQGRHAEAEKLLLEALDARSRTLGQEHPSTLFVMNNLAAIYGAQGKYSQAEALSAKVLELRRRVLGEEHPDTLTSMNDLAVTYREEGKYAEAEPLFMKAVEMRRRMQGEEHPYTLATMVNLSSVYRYQEDYPRATSLMIKVLDIQRRVLGEAHPDRLASMNRLADYYVSQGKHVQAEALAREALSGYQKNSPDNWMRYSTESLLGASLLGQRKYSAAEPLLLSGYQGLVQRNSVMPASGRSVTKEAAQRILRLYKNWPKPEQATAWQKRLEGK